MTGMVGGVCTDVGPGTQVLALRGPGPAGHRRVQDRATAGAVQLLEAHPGTGLAVAAVT